MKTKPSQSRPPLYGTLCLRKFVAVNLYKPSNAFLKHSCLTQLIIRMLVLFQVTCKLIIIVQ